MEKYFVYQYEPFGEVLEDERMLAMLKDDRLYSFMPNFQSWVQIQPVEMDYFTGDPTAQFIEVDQNEAYKIAQIIRPYNPIIAEIVIKDVPKDRIIPFNPEV